ncbi:MAG: nucleotidyl transferase AbiEii/AbiGii toxin family protein [Bacteroidota bacterium]
MTGLTQNTKNNIEKISKLSCVNDYTLIGGTALSLQIGKRLSEDLDFCKWATGLKKDKPTVDWYNIENELRTVGNIEKKDILGFEHVNFIVNGVKLSFFAKQFNLSPLEKPVFILNNIIAADIKSIGVMKLEVCIRRSEFRDYYDIYSILKEGVSLKELILKAEKYSNHSLKTRDVLHLLSNGSRFIPDKQFELLQPVYKVSASDIEGYIKERIIEEYPK